MMKRSNTTPTTSTTRRTITSSGSGLPRHEENGPMHNRKSAMTPSPFNQDSSRGRKINAGLKNIGSRLQRFNLARLIDEMERDQELADQLEVINCELREEQQRRIIVQEAEAMCRAAIERHFFEYVREHPKATYEEWIEDLHPENAHERFERTEIDHRFYVQNSDHRLLWNKNSNGVRTSVPAKRWELRGNNASSGTIVSPAAEG